MKTLQIFFLCVLSCMAGSTMWAQVEVKNGIPFKDGGKVLPGMENGQVLYALVNEVLNGSPYDKKPPYSNIPGFELGDDFDRAWKASRSFFDKRIIYTPTSEYFMMHGPYNGNICIVVYNTNDLRKIMANYAIFNSEQNLLAYSQKIIKENNQAKIQEFEDKLGKLSGYFANKKSLDKLKKYLGKELYQELMKTLREENMHLLAGAMLHEGMHAINDKAYALQEAFKSGACPLELNELRAYMAEIIYHATYYNWAVNNIDYHWSEIDRLLGELEQYRMVKPEKMTDAQKAEFAKKSQKIEEIKAQIKAHIAMIRVRLKEIRESAKRINDLMMSYLKDYVKPIQPKKNLFANAEPLIEQIKALAAISAKFLEDTKKAADAHEKALKFLEGVLDEWNQYASCKRLTPPPPDTIIVDTIRKRDTFPHPPLDEAKEIKKGAEEGMNKYSVEFQSPGTEKNAVYQPLKEPALTFTAGINVSSLAMKNLNNYFDYLNQTWTGNLQPIRTGTGFNLGLQYRLSSSICFGLDYEQVRAETGEKSLSGSTYRSENGIQGLLGTFHLKSPLLLNALRLRAGVSVGPYFSTYTETENTFVTKGKDQQVGWKAGVGIEWMITPSLGFSVGGGYRNLHLDQYGVAFFQPGNPPVSLDYSGVFGEVKALLQF